MMNAFDFKNAETKTTLIKFSYNKNFDLTIAIPTFNRLEQLQKTIESAVNQSEENYNIIVVNNSEDTEHNSRVKDIINRIDYKYLSYYENNSNLGMFDNWNMCIALSQTKFCSILNDDDLLMPDFVRFFRAFKKNDSLFVSRVIIYGDGKIYLYRKFKSLLYFIRHIIFGAISTKPMPINKQLKGNSIHASLGVVFNVNEAISLNGYNKDIYPAADVDFSHRYSNKIGVTYIFKELGKYFHGGAYSDNSVALQCAACEYERRQNILNNLNVNNSYLIKFGNKINILHYFSYTQYLNCDDQKKMDLINLSSDQIPKFSFNNRMVFILWDVFSIFVYFFKRD